MPNSPTQTALVPRREGPHSVNTLVSAFESETADVFVRTTPSYEHVTLYVILAIIVIGIVFLSVAKVDRVVSGVGHVVTSQGQLFVQTLDKAIVRQIRVHAGDIVKRGDVLATLDPTFTTADVTQLEAKFASDEAEVARFEAEQNDRDFNPSGTNFYDNLQLSIWRQRHSEYRSELADFDAKIKNAQAGLAQEEHDVGDYRKRFRVAAELEKMNVTLEQQGWGSRLRTLGTTDTRVELGRLLSNSQNQIVATRETLKSQAAERAAYIDKWRSDAGAELGKARKDLDATRQDLNKARKLSQLVELRAPEDAIVLKIGKVSVGSVAEGGPGSEPLFVLVPLSAALEADIDVNSEDIGFIRPNDAVQIKLDAYQYIEHGTAKGIIKSISEGSFTPADNDNNRDTHERFFRVRVAFTDIHLHDVPANFRLIPGMTLDADIKVGKHSIISYLISGVARRGSEAMREP
jgi:HlyD family type I secretion membrane fusion protein